MLVLSETPTKDYLKDFRRVVQVYTDGFNKMITAHNPTSEQRSTDNVEIDVSFSH